MSKLITRRSLFAGIAASIICAPAIVKIASIMPVKSMGEDGEWTLIGPSYIYVFQERESRWERRDYGNAEARLLANSVAMAA